MYEVTTDEVSQQQIDALPADALAAFAEVRVVLEVAPWNGTPYHRSKPATPMRRMVFGAHGQGDVVYLILEDQRRVDLLDVLWMD